MIQAILSNPKHTDLPFRLDSFDKHELAKFQGVATSRGYYDIIDLINLTFCCQGTTIVQDFTDLSAVGRGHYMDIHGGATEEELNTVDFRKAALSLLLNEDGKVTPYGVVYENGMHLEQLYDGRHFPNYDYDGESVMAVTMANHKPENSALITWLYLPMEECRMERVMLRSGIDTFGDMRLQFHWSDLPTALDTLLSSGSESLRDLNELCADFKALDDGGRKKLEAVMKMAAPSNIVEVRNLMAQPDLFDFVPDVFTPEEYGRHMITESGHYEYDSELAEFYDFKKYGEQRMKMG